jgi:hypothetical protein
MAKVFQISRTIALLRKPFEQSDARGRNGPDGFTLDPADKKGMLEILKSRH